MKRTEKKNENNISYLPSSIKWGWRVALLGVCVWGICKIGASVASVIGIYFLVTSVFKIIRLSIRIISYLLTIFFLLAVVAILTLIIF